MAKLSIVISAYNEEKKITACLESVKWADEIIFIDNSSTDKTHDIAKHYTKKVFKQKNDPENIDLQKNFGIGKATGEWILILDADEEVSLELRKEIEDKILNDQRVKTPEQEAILGYWIPRKNLIFGKWIEHTGWYPDYQLRLFKKGSGKFAKKHYHEPIQLEGETARLTEHFIHHNYESMSQFFYKSFQTYAPNEAEELLRNGYAFDYRDAVRFPLREFLSRYFAREGYKDGFHGFMLSLLMAFYHLAIFSYLWEKKKFVDNADIDVLKGIEKEMKKSKKEMAFWMSKKSIEGETNPLKKVGLRVRKKLHL